MSELVQLAYISNPIHNIGHISDLDILREAMERNQQCSITGFLTRGPKSFCQILEGPKASIERVFEGITGDNRHYDIRTLYTIQTITRIFPSWSMGYAEVTEAEEFAILAETETDAAHRAKNISEMILKISETHQLMELETA